LKAEDAADTVQEVFASVAMHVADFERQNPHDSFTAWLLTITRNKIRDHFRRNVGRPLAPGGTRAQERMGEIPQPDPAVVLEARPSTADLMEAEKIISRRAMELVRTEFQERTWEAWYKMAVEGRPAADVAADMNMSLSAVYKAKSRVLLRLRQELAGLHGEIAN